jgi:hypothetical protein
MAPRTPPRVYLHTSSTINLLEDLEMQDLSAAAPPPRQQMAETDRYLRRYDRACLCLLVTVLLVVSGLIAMGIVLATSLKGYKDPST